MVLGFTPIPEHGGSCSWHYSGDLIVAEIKPRPPACQTYAQTYVELYLQSGNDILDFLVFSKRKHPSKQGEIFKQSVHCICIMSYKVFLLFLFLVLGYTGWFLLLILCLENNTVIARSTTCSAGYWNCAKQTSYLLYYLACPHILILVKWTK